MADVATAPAIGVSIQVELPGKKQVVFQTHIAQDASPAQINAVLDKIQDAGDRQFARYAIEQCKLQLEVETKLAEDHETRMAIVERNIESAWSNGGKRGDRKLNSREESERVQAINTAEDIKKRIAKTKDTIAGYQKIIDGTPSQALAG